MRTKTILLSALLGALGGVSVHAQTNVYSLNTVGYINAVLAPGFNIITCPLIASPDNTVGTVLNNSTGFLDGSTVYFYNNVSGGYSSDNASLRATNANGWVHDGTNVLAPGVACWFLNGSTTNITNTFVGSVPSDTTYNMTNTLLKGFNLVGSILPSSGDIVTNTLTGLTNYNVGDDVYTYGAGGFTEFISSGRGTIGYKNNWTSPQGDPNTSTVYQGMFYLNSGATVEWVESYSVSE